MLEDPLHLLTIQGGFKRCRQEKQMLRDGLTPNPLILMFQGGWLFNIFLTGAR